jgi:hypothetical protein
VRFNGAYHNYAQPVLKRECFDHIDFGGSIHLAMALGEATESRRSRIYGGRD